MSLLSTCQAYYKLESNSNDSVGSANGTDTSMTYGSSYGKIGNGALFNGSTSKVDLPAIPLTGVLSGGYGIWFKTSSATRQTIYGFGDTGGSGIQAELYTDGTFGYYDPSNGSRGYSGTDYRDGNWHFLFLRYTAGVVRIYMDGSQVFTDGASGLNLSAGNAHFVGRRIYNDTTSAWNGSMDEFSVFNSPPSDSDILSLYNSGAGLQYPFTTATFDVMNLGHFA